MLSLRGRKFAPALFMSIAAMAMCGVVWGGNPVDVSIDGTSSGYPDLGGAINYIASDLSVDTTSNAIVVTVNENQAGTTNGAGWLWDFGNGNTLGTPNGGYTDLKITGSGQYSLMQNSIVDGDNRLMVIQGVNAPSAPDRASLTISGLTYNGGNYTDKTMSAGDDIRGAGLLVYEIDTGAIVNIGGATPASSVTFSNNVIDIEATSSALISANGAGLYLDGRDAGWTAGAVKGTTNLDRVALTENIVTAVGHTATDSSASGGGALVNSIETFAYSNGTVTGNSVSGTDLGHVKGGGISFEYAGTTGDAEISLKNVAFSTNTVSLTDGLAGGEAYAQGGAFSVFSDSSTDVIDAKVEVTDSSIVAFNGNSATIGGDMTANGIQRGVAVGGAVAFVQSGEITGSFKGTVFNNNSAVSTVAVETGSIARGGAFAHDDNGKGDTEFIAAKFTGNHADSVGLARGGAMYVNQDGTITIGDATATAANGLATAFSGNYATTSGTTAAANAEGGAIYVGADASLEVNSFSSFSQNRATATAATGTANAQGGALFLTDGTKATLGKNISFTGNYTDLDQSTGLSQGAPYMSGVSL